jgi:hypothetical protein
MRDLLGSINLNELLILNETMIQDHKINNIDFEGAQPKLKTLISNSRSFLNKALH